MDYTTEQMENGIGPNLIDVWIEDLRNSPFKIIVEVPGGPDGGYDYLSSEDLYNFFLILTHSGAYQRPGLLSNLADVEHRCDKMWRANGYCQDQDQDD